MMTSQPIDVPRWPQLLGRAANAALLVIGAAVLWVGSGLPLPSAAPGAVARVRGLTTVFLGIVIEALPFLVAGVLVASFVTVFVSPARLQRIAPRHPLAAALVGALLGLAIPICECGAIPMARSLMRKGASPALGVAFMLAAPVVNPIVIAGTFAAFGAVYGAGFVAWRVGLSIVIAMIVALMLGRSGQVLATATHDGQSHDHNHDTHKGWQRLAHALDHAVDEFFEMSRFLVIGALLAALLQSLVSPTELTAYAGGPLLATLGMMTLAAVLSICSTVDSFIALAFVGSVAPGPILAFLVFGPMVDIKSVLMFTRVLPLRNVLALVALVAALTLGLTLVAGAIL